MANMKKKSEENVLSAVLLIDNSLFTSSVHCSYYAGFQFTKYVLANFCGIDYERQEKESKGKDSHFKPKIIYKLIQNSAHFSNKKPYC